MIPQEPLPESAAELIDWLIDLVQTVKGLRVETYFNRMSFPRGSTPIGGFVDGLSELAAKEYRAQDLAALLIDERYSAAIRGSGDDPTTLWRLVRDYAGYRAPLGASEVDKWVGLMRDCNAEEEARQLGPLLKRLQACKANLVASHQPNPAGAAADPSRSSETAESGATKRWTPDEAQGVVSAYIRQREQNGVPIQKITRDRIATDLKMPGGTVSNTNAWSALAQRKRQAKLPHGPAPTDIAPHTEGDADEADTPDPSAKLARLTAEQKADEKADQRRRPQRR